MFNNAFSRGLVVQDLLRGGAHSSSAPSSQNEMQKIIKEQQEIINSQRDLLASNSKCSNGKSNNRETDSLLAPGPATNNPRLFASNSTSFSFSNKSSNYGSTSSNGKLTSSEMYSQRQHAVDFNQQSAKLATISSPHTVSLQSSGTASPDTRPIPKTVDLKELVIKQSQSPRYIDSNISK